MLSRRFASVSDTKLLSASPLLCSGILMTRYQPKSSPAKQQQQPPPTNQQQPQEPLTPTPSRHGPNAGRSMAASTNKRRFENAPTTMPPWQRMAKLCRREHNEELRRAYRPPFPKVPTGWQVLHDAGTAYFTLTKNVSPADRAPGSSAEETLRIFCAGAIKEPERTFRHDDGEREDPEHLNYTLFISKPSAAAATSGTAADSSSAAAATEKSSSSNSNKENSNKTSDSPWTGPKSNIASNAAGGLEIQMTTIDHELVLDAITVHTNKKDFDVAWDALTEGPQFQWERDTRYRGPYIGELDEEFVDEILNYLDERGINNAFASYMQSQWHWFEQLEYEEWLKMYQTFSTPGITDGGVDQEEDSSNKKPEQVEETKKE